MSKTLTIDAVHLFSGFSDYWSGDGERWEANKGCLFAHYGRETTYQDLIDGWVEDFNMGGDLDDSPLAENLTDEALREALREIFVEDLDMDSVVEGAQYLDEDWDEENDESPVHIVLVRLS